MMDPIDLAIEVLKRNDGVRAITTMSRIYSTGAPEKTTLAHVVVNVVAGDDEQLLSGPAKMYETRFQFDCNSLDKAEASRLGAAVCAALEDTVRTEITIKGVTGFKFNVDFRRDGTDLTRANDNPVFSQRIVGFYMNWQRLPAT